MTDHVSPSTGMGGKESTASFTPYILLMAFEKVSLHSKHNCRKSEAISLKM